MVQAIGKNVLYMAMTALTIYLKLSINYIKLFVLRYAQFTKYHSPKCIMYSGFANFETNFADFESRSADYLSVSRIQAVTLCPMRCLKARLKVL